MKKIFLIDNDEKETSQIGRILSDGGYDMTVSNDGAEAFEILRAQTFDLVIADIDIQGLDSFSILNWIAVHKQDTKVIMTTGKDSRSISHAAVRMGALCCLEKPIGGQYLLDTVHEYLNETGFSGTISKITLADYLQLCIYTTATKNFEVIKGSRRGVIVIKEGQIVYADYGDLKGEDAFYEILSLEGGRINEIRIKGCMEPNISMESGFLLLEATRRHDENQLQAALEGHGEGIPGSARDRAQEGNLPEAGAGQLPGLAPSEENISGTGISRILDQSPGVLEYGIFSTGDVLQERSTDMSISLNIAPSLFFNLSENLDEMISGAGLRYLVITTRSGVRYILFRDNGNQVVAGLKPGVKPAEIFQEIRNTLTYNT
ncbi:MAG TPA: response regulator [Deltaproteobacteria bacterium]|nr:response regulator [Deltaproteobacteria bacterium]HXK47823.1 response regulator [Deltaproteobacteria bacterium]